MSFLNSYNFHGLYQILHFHFERRLRSACKLSFDQLCDPSPLSKVHKYTISLLIRSLIIKKINEVLAPLLE